MQVERIISTLVVPGRRDLLGRIAENGAKLVVYSYGAAKFFLNCINASL
jgi:hypothetical protein